MMARNRNYILDPSYKAQQEALDKIAEMLGGISFIWY